MDTRGVCRAYVGEQGAIFTNDIGSSSYHDMFMRAPPKCRYTIVEKDNRFFVCDLWKSQSQRKGDANIGVVEFLPPKSIHAEIYDDLDVAIAATVLNYSTVFSLLQLERYTPIRRLVRWLQRKRER